MDSTEWLLGGGGRGNRTPNETARDVTLKTCWGNYDQVACVRSSFLCVLSALTGLACIVRLSRLHLAPGPKNPHLLALFYICSVHTFSGAVDWIWGWTTAGELGCLYLRSLELIVVTHFYLTLTSRVFHCHADLVPRLLVMSLSLLFVFFTTCAVVGLTSREGPWVDCAKEYWLWIASGHLATIQVLLGTSWLLCRKLNSVRAEAVFKAAQKRTLWLLLAAFETSAAANLAYHLVVFLLAHDSCSQVFSHRQLEYSLVRAGYEVLVFLLPIWVVLWAFRPSSQPANVNVPQHSDMEQLVDPRLVAPSQVINWRERFRPAATFNSLISPHSAPLRPNLLLSHRHRRWSAGLSRRSRRVRRATSAPSLRKGVASPSTTSPPLATIPEESAEQSASHTASPGTSLDPHGSTIPGHYLPTVSASVDVHLP